VEFDKAIVTFAKEKDIRTPKGELDTHSAGKSLRAAIRRHKPTCDKRMPEWKNRKKGDGYRVIELSLLSDLIAGNVE
jgi:hypothetical protein